MSRLMVIGCGGVASVAVHKCCQNSGVFTELMIASRTKSKCDALKAQLEGKTDTVITTAQVDADKVEELEALIRSYKPDSFVWSIFTLTFNFISGQISCTYFMFSMILSITHFQGNDFGRSIF